MDESSSDLSPPRVSDKPRDPDKIPAKAAGSPIGRRLFLGMVGLGAVGIVAGSRIETVVGKALEPLQEAAPSALGGLIPGGDTWQIYNASDGAFPDVSNEEFRLVVDGMVDTPLSLRYSDLEAMPPTRLVKTFQCVTGWRVPNVHWQGVALSEILDRAGVQSGATALRFFSYDNFDTESLTLPQARRSDVIAAYSMLGAPVTREHGGPVRLYVAPMYGYKSIKWMSRIEVTNEVVPGYWEQNGYSVNAWIGDSNGLG
jgi:DMSO/TMAO reductase YedYZ molybdopterin-dependent catalytic subunit